MKLLMLIGMLLILLMCNGCWDRQEINDLGLVMGTGLDLAENGKIQATIQIAVPSPSSQAPGGSSKETDNFFLISASGNNWGEIEQKLQQKMSRTLSYSHRSVILIGEALARQGINDILDTFTRQPRNRLKTYILVVKGKKAEDLLKVKYPYELAPSEALKEMELLRGEGTIVTLRDYMIASATEGMSPTIGVLESDLYYSPRQKGEDKLFRINETAVFKSSKLVGFLNNIETHEYLWFKKNKMTDTIVADLPDGLGNVGFILTKSQINIDAELNGDNFKFHVYLKGTGDLFENNSSLDVSELKNIEFVKQVLERKIKTNMNTFLHKIQSQFKTDIIGFGQHLQRKDRKKWRKVENTWDHHFETAEISISVKLTINNTGAIGPALHFKEKEIIN